jgi:hypothetical protein
MEDCAMKSQRSSKASGTGWEKAKVVAVMADTIARILDLILQH